MEYLKKLHMICFNLLEFKQLYKKDCEKNIRIATDKLYNDKKKRNKIINYVTKERLKNKENIEIFVAISFIVTFFNNSGKICFVLKNNFNVKKEYIKNIDDLKMAIEENTLTDFAIWNNGLRQFQLKQYRFELKTDQLFKFIKEKLNGYGNDLEDVNLLIMLQGLTGGKIYSDGKIKIMNNNIDYQKINLKLKKLDLNYKGQILIFYNENNKFEILNQVYPKLKTKRILINQDYLAE